MAVARPEHTKMKKKQGSRWMPWKNLPPDIIEAVLHVAGILVAGLIGALSRIADEMKTGMREKFWGKELLVDLTSFSVMVLAGAAVAEYLELGKWGSFAVVGLACRAGTPALDVALKVFLERVAGVNFKRKK